MHDDPNDFQSRITDSSPDALPKAGHPDFNPFRDALEYSALVSITDLQGKIVYCNRAFQRLSQYSEKELLGQDHRILHSGQHPKQFWVEMWQQVAKGQPWRGEVCNRAKDGSRYWVDTTINPMRNESGKVTQYLSIRYDITSRKEAEEKRDRLIRDLEQYAFLTSHDLRRPLSSILGLTNLIMMGEVKDDLIKVISMLAQQSREMDQVVHRMNKLLEDTSLQTEFTSPSPQTNQEKGA